MYMKSDAEKILDTEQGSEEKLSMSTKTVPLSVRVSLDDAEFISQLDVAGAATPSDKLRTIITDARQRVEGLHDYEGCLRNFLELTSSAVMRLRKLEHQENVHSELVFKVVQWAQETLAFITAEVPGGIEDKELSRKLKELESGVADRAFGLIEAVLRMGITKNSNCYTPTTVSSRVNPVLEISNVISSTNSK